MGLGDGVGRFGQLLSQCGKPTGDLLMVGGFAFVEGGEVFGVLCDL